MESLQSKIALLNKLPKGYISIKVIHGKEYYYLQYLENGKLKSKYIKEENLESVKIDLLYRNELEKEIYELRSKGKDLPVLSKRSIELTGSLMMEDVEVARYDKGTLTYINESLCPLLIKRTHNIKEYLKTRVIDSTRINSRLLKKALNIHETKDELISLYSYGATITDNYWFKTKGSKLKYNDISFNGDFYSDLALNGELIVYPKTPKLTPALTTPGSYEKCWKEINNEWYLIKKGNEYEIHSELFCSKLAKLLNIQSATYEYDNGNIKTKNFADKYNFEPMTSIAGEDDNYENVFNSLFNLDKTLCKDYIRLMFFDALVNNVDRHNENMGILRDKKTGKIISLAPNFDNNLALISRNKVLDLNAKSDGFIKLFIKFLKSNKEAMKLYKEMKIPKLTNNIIRGITDVTPLDVDKDMIEKYIMNRYKYLLSIKD